jgi:hypothetical protein
MVTDNSAALTALHSLNQNYQQRLKYPGPIVYNWEDRVNSKAKLDRYDLHTFFLARLAVLEDQILKSNRGTDTGRLRVRRIPGCVSTAWLGEARPL